MDSLLDPFRSDRKPGGRRARRRRQERRSRSLRATIAAVTAGAMLAIGLPTMAFAAGEASDGTAPESAQVASESVEPGTGESTAPSEEPAAEEPPAEEPTAEEPPAEEPPAEEPPAEEPPAEAPPAKPAPAEPAPAPEAAEQLVAPMAVFPADTADCTTNCGNLTITNVVSGGPATASQWTLHAVRSSNSDNYNFTSGQTRPVPRNNTYTLFADNGPANYTTTFECTTGGSGNNDPDWDEGDRTVTFSNTNGSPTQKFANCTFTQTYSGPATINVQVGGARTGISSVGGLGGVTLQLYTDNGGSFGSIINQPWATCTSTAAGVCSFVVPNANNSNFWVAQATPGVPAGWFSNDTLATGTSPTSADYRFRIADVDAGETLSSLSDFMIATGNTANNASGGIWQNSLANPTRAQQCGVRIALVIDLSGSVEPNFADLKDAAKGFVTALQGTPSQVGIFTFNNVAPASVGGNLGITPVSTVGGANTVRNHIDSFGTPSGATNWDRGIYQVATSGTQYDIALVLTDGNPTVYANNEGPGNRTRFREVENGVFSANAVKALGTRVIAFGVGSGVGGSPDNLVAISGSQLNSDYFQSASYDQAGTILRNLALGACQGSVSVVKQVVSNTSTGEQKTGQTPAGGWTFTAEPTTGGITPASQSGVTAAGTGAVNLPLTFAGGTTSGTVKVTEDPQGHSIVTSGGKNAVCTDVATGNAITVTNETNGFSVPVSSTQAVTCTVWNRPPLPQSTYSVNKVWVVNGVTYQNGQQPIGLTAQLTVGGANAPWVTPQGPVPANTVVSLNETTSVGSRDLCRITDSKVTLANGSAPANGALPYSATLQPGDNTYTITNTVTCDSQLTLKKTVSNGPVAASAWNLDAVAPGGALAGPNGATGSPGATAFVTPNVTYPLVETGDPRYVQTLGLNAVPIPPATGSWDCVQVNAGGTVVPGFADGLNGGVTVPLGFRVQCTAVNQTASLTLIKNVDNDLGIDADPSDWTLTATPNAPAIPGLDAQDATTGETVYLRPGKAYTVSESGGPDGWTQTSVMCRTSPNGQYVETDQITLPALGQGTCVISNDPIAPTLELTKIVTGDVAPANEWTLSASRADDDQVVASGDGTTGVVAVPAGVAFELAESTDLPNADQFGPGAWLCSLNGGPDIPGPNVAALGAGDAVECTVTNTLKPFTPSITKTAAVPTPNADGSWTIAYDIVVTNPSAFQPIDYILSDQLDFGSEVTVNSASYQRVQPLPAGAVEDWTVGFDAVQPFDDEPQLAAGTSHTWRVTVNATVDADADFTGSTQGACDDLEPGTIGFLNTATMYVGQVPYEASDCELPVKPTIAKQGGTAVDNGDGTWTLPYTITVTNPSATTSVVYDLVDELDLPTGVTATGPATVVVQPVPTEASWTGFAPNTLLADDVTLAGTAGVDQHVYQVQVIVEIGADQAGFRCPGDGGLNNVATVESGNQSDDATGCVTVDPPVIEHDKTVVPGSVSQGADGLWTIQYRIDVDNTGAVGGTYSLEDELHFGAGVDLSGAGYAVTRDGSPAAAGWAGTGSLVADAYLAGGASDVWIITVTGIALEGPTLTPAQTACPQDDADGAFNNAAVLTVGGIAETDTACDSPSAPDVLKSGATASQQLDATWDVSYLLTVSNTAPGAKAGYYSLDDVPGFPASVTLNSYTVEEVSPVAGPITTDASPVPATIPVVADEPIAAGAVHVYRITLNATVPSGLPENERLCVDGQSGVGFFNEARLTSGEIVDTSDDCTPVEPGGRPTVEKSDPTVTQDGEGVWTVEYDVTVTGNGDYISTYTLEDTLHFGSSVEILTAEWAGQGTDGEWEDPEANPTETIVATPEVIDIDEVHSYTVTVTAKVDEVAFTDPTTNTCDPSDEEPNVGFLNTATLTSDGVPQSDDGCGLPAEPEVTKTAVGTEAVKVGDHWEATYEITVENLSTSQSLVYDLADTPDFADGVTITDRAVTSADVTVNPAWNGASPATDVIVEDQELAGGATHTFTVTVSFTVDDADGSPALLCEGDDGQGLLNGAVVTSGGTWTDDDCLDVPVIVIVDKAWVIDGGEPIAWDSDELPDGFTAQGQLDGTDVDWDAENGPYSLGDEVAIGETDVVVPEGCEIVDAVGNGTGEYTLDATVNNYLVTNEVDCVQTVNLEKIVTNAHGGDAVASDWTVSASTPEDGFGGPGEASGPVDLNVGYTLNEVSVVWEDGVAYEVAATWSCSSEQGADAFTLVSTPGSTEATLTVTELGATVDCEIENIDIAPTLTLVKDVAPDSVEAEFPPTLWTVSATEEGEAAVVTGDGTATGEVESNVDYVLAELASDFEGADEFEAGAWSCDVPGVLTGDTANLEPGDDVTCTIVNTAKPASYLFDKEVTGVVQEDDGTWTIAYTVTVTNESVVSPVTYDLVDSLAGFGEGIEIDEASWTGPDGSGDVWEDPATEPVEELANDVVLTAAVGTHEYLVTVHATVTGDAVWDEGEGEGDGSTGCVPGEQGGFANSATLTVDGLPTDDEACDEPGRTTAVKVAHPATYLGLGDWEVTYDITVDTVGDHDLVYDLGDTLVFPDGVTIEEATAEDPDGNPVAGWNGEDATTLATAHPITAGDTHVWTITVRANVASIESIDLAKCEATETGGGFLNTAEMVNGTVVTELEGCTDIPVGKLKLTKTVDNTALLDLGFTPDELLAATDWNLSADSGTHFAEYLNGGGTSLVVPTGSYELGEELQTEQEDHEFADYYTADAWLCGEAAVTHAQVQPGGVTECTVKNVADSFDVGIEKTYLLPDGVTAVEAGDAFEYELTVTNHGTLDVTGLEVTDLLPDDLVVTGAATFTPAAAPVQPGTWTQTSGDTDNAFSATYSGSYPSGAVTTITIPVQVAVPAPLPPVPPVGPNDPPPVLPVIDLDDIHNEACVAIPVPAPEEADRAAAAAETMPDMVPANDCDDVDVPTKAIDPSAYTRCVADVPYLYHNVAVSENVEPGPITVTWTPDPTVYPDAVPVVMEIPWDERDGRLLWPYGVVNDEGISIGWPGWRLIQEGDVVGENGIVDIWENMVKDSKLESYAFADQVNPMTVTFSVNPSQSILAVYPQATPACEVVRDPAVDIVKTASVEEVKPGGAFDYTLSVTNSGLGAIENMELFDEIPADLKVTEITTDEAPAFPRWDDCEVTGADSDGYGGLLHCVLNGMIGGTQPDAPDVVLSVVLDPATKVDRVENTGEVCWNDPDDAPVEPQLEPGTVAPAAVLDPELPILCDDSTVTVRVPQPPAPGIASTGFAGGPLLWGAAGLLLVGALLVSVTIVRRRRPGEQHTS
ncbi:hypothetical protein [Agromyces sp. NPDC058126]|uniref:hypothetical protein n=1 Tax=Agromyces sp. NPDC058126 TaxID=3346350 RepID=UPI0036D86804